jgi:hypothetical protein
MDNPSPRQCGGCALALYSPTGQHSWQWMSWRLVRCNAQQHERRNCLDFVRRGQHTALPAGVSASTGHRQLHRLHMPQGLPPSPPAVNPAVIVQSIACVLSTALNIPEASTPGTPAGQSNPHLFRCLHPRGCTNHESVMPQTSQARQTRPSSRRHNAPEATTKTHKYPQHRIH